MECRNIKCSKSILHTYSCNKCSFKFCSNSCMIDHFFDKHQYNDEESNREIKNSTGLIFNIKKNKRNSVTSQFIKQGEFLKELKYDSYFKFDNFDKVKMGKKSHVLGAGAFGDVFLIKHKIDGKFFAVKQMEKQKILQAGAKLDIVQREVDIHCRLIHENIIRLYTFHEDQDSFYLILEYANSGTLFSSIKKNKGFTEEKAFKYFIQTAAALYFIHENGLAHRDIKPENLLIDENDIIKLCDFGWCIELEIGNRSTFCGTVEYMAPEIVKEMPYDKSIDVWSLGILLYELLHGYSPFRAKNGRDDEEYSEIFKNILQYKFKIENSKISEECCDLITKLLTPETSSRLKVKDIFSHPWVQNFENILNKNNTNQDIEGEKSKISKNNLSTTINEEENKLLKSPKSPKSPQLKKKKSDNQNLIRKASKKESNPQEDNREKVLEKLKIKKLNSIQHALNSTDDFSYYENNDKTDALFDKVLTQVKEKNKDKRKKGKILDELYEFDIEKVLKNENKIILKVNREERQNSIEKGNNKNKFSSSKAQDFSMLKEINEINNDLNKHIYEQIKQFDSLNNKKLSLNQTLEKNKLNFKSADCNITIEDENDLDNTRTKNTSNSNNISKNGNLTTLHPMSSKGNPKISYDEELDTGRKNKIISETKTKKKGSMNKTLSSNYNDILYFSHRERDSIKNSKISTSKKRESKDFIIKDLDFREYLSNDFLYNGKTTDDSKNYFFAIELLEKAQKNKREIDRDNNKANSVWDKFSNLLGPFKCGGDK